MKEIIRPKKLSQPKAPFSYGIVTKPGKILFLAGQTPVNEHGEIVGVGDFETQAKQVFENLKTVVETAGGRFSDIVKVTIYITDVKRRQALDRVRTAYYGSNPPTSTLVRRKWSRTKGLHVRGGIHRSLTGMSGCYHNGISAAARRPTIRPKPKHSPRLPPL